MHIVVRKHYHSIKSQKLPVVTTILVAFLSCHYFKSFLIFNSLLPNVFKHSFMIIMKDIVHNMT